MTGSDSRGAVRTSWTDDLQNDDRPCPASLKEHLLEVHARHPGFTEGCATKCRDASGRTSYEWLCDAIDPERHRRVLDLACGSGFLLALCRKRFPDTLDLTGVDMSDAELALARERLAGENVALRQGLAQDLSFAADHSVNAVLCHWALTLMDPIEPVLREVDRVATPGGVFGAIVDGDPQAAPSYAAINEMVFKYVRRELPTYGERDLGDPRARVPQSLATLARDVCENAVAVSTETSAFSLQGEPAALAREAVGFFYAAYVLPFPSRTRLIAELTEFFARNAVDGVSGFSLPICRLLVTF